MRRPIQGPEGFPLECGDPAPLRHGDELELVAKSGVRPPYSKALRAAIPPATPPRRGRTRWKIGN